MSDSESDIDDISHLLNNINFNTRDDIKDFLIILGSGASVDSGLPTYRGPEGIYTNDDFDPETFFSKISIKNDIDKIWDFFNPLLKQTIQCSPGPTYTAIDDLLKKYPNSFIITQNIDGLIYKVIDESKFVEIHGNNRNMICVNKNCQLIQPININKPSCDCGFWCRPDIVCYGESLDTKKVQKCNIETKKFYKYVLVIGTTLQFGYLKTFVENAKRRFAKVIHINPDTNYITNVRDNEYWIKMDSKSGIKMVVDVLDKHINKYDSNKSILE